MALAKSILDWCELRDCQSWLQICNTIKLESYQIINIPDSLSSGNAVLILDLNEDFHKIHELFLLEKKLCFIIKSNESNLFGRKKSVIFHDAFIKKIVLSNYYDNFFEFQITFPFYDIIESALPYPKEGQSRRP